MPQMLETDVRGLSRLRPSQEEMHLEREDTTVTTFDERIRFAFLFLGMLAVGLAFPVGIAGVVAIGHHSANSTIPAGCKAAYAVLQTRATKLEEAATVALHRPKLTPAAFRQLVLAAPAVGDGKACGL